jgi:MoaA/NifB/PqqE/SkfB family radical SAM enzyme
MWNRKVVPDAFIISGGEPLLHPEINKIIALAVKYWCNSKVILWTNGILSNKITDT